MSNSSQQPPSAIQCRRLSKSLGGRLVLRGIDLEIASGQCVALTGSNGAGKTTLLRCLAGRARPTQGEVRWFGRRAGADPRQRQRVGMAAHDSRLYGHLTLRENLLFAARMCAVAAAARRAESLLEQTGLRPWADRQAREISKGMRQRLALARALIHDPPIVLLDEPFSGLDAAGRQWLAALLGEQRQAGRTICFATHDETQTRQLADRLLVLQAGTLAADTAADHRAGCNAA